MTRTRGAMPSSLRADFRTVWRADCAETHREGAGNVPAANSEDAVVRASERAVELLFDFLEVKETR